MYKKQHDTAWKWRFGVGIDIVLVAVWVVEIYFISV